MSSTANDHFKEVDGSLILNDGFTKIGGGGHQFEDEGQITEIDETAGNLVEAVGGISWPSQP